MITSNAQKDLTQSQAISGMDVKATPGIFRGVRTRPGPHSLPTWLPGRVLGMIGGWRVCPIGADARANPNPFAKPSI